MIERMFKLSAQGTSVRTEVLAGFTTFLTMAYIVIVNPTILGPSGCCRSRRPPASPPASAAS